MKIVHGSQSKKEIFNELADKRFNEITELDKKVNLDYLIYRYKDNTPNEEFNTYANALDLVNKIKNGEIKLAEAKNNQINFKSNLSEIKEEVKNQKSRKKQYTILKCFTKQGKRLLIFLIIIFNGI